jgi:hypothetical protein
VGWVVIALGLVALVLGFRERRRLSPRTRALLYAGPPLVIVLVLCSLRSPYPIGGVDVPMPSRIVFEIAPYVRAVGRFAIAVIAVAVVMGALGLHLLARRRAEVGRIAMVAGALVLTAVEFGSAAPLPTVVPSLVEGVPARDLPAWAWLRAHPGGIVLNLPGPGNSALERYYMLGAAENGHPTLNAISNPGEPGGEFLREVMQPYAPEAARLLATAGVRYVVLNGWAYVQSGFKIGKQLPPRQYRLLARFPDQSSVWQVTARPADGLVIFEPDGFDVNRTEVRGPVALNWRWLLGAGTVEARVPRAGTYRARFRASPWQRPYRLVVVSPDGSRSAVEVRREQMVDLTLRLPAGTSRLRLQAEPRPALPTTPSVQVTPWILTRTGP